MELKIGQTYVDRNGIQFVVTGTNPGWEGTSSEFTGHQVGYPKKTCSWKADGHFFLTLDDPKDLVELVPIQFSFTPGQGL